MEQSDESLATNATHFPSSFGNIETVIFVRCCLDRQEEEEEEEEEEGRQDFLSSRTRCRAGCS
eukprot:766066-Hanusia_phi.AAC.4